MVDWEVHKTTGNQYLEINYYQTQKQKKTPQNDRNNLEKYLNPL